MRSADLPRAQHIPLRIVPRLGQRPENGSEVVASKDRWDVLHDDESRSYFANQSHPLEEQSAAFAVDAGLLAGDGDVLAREAAAPYISRRDLVTAQGRDVLMTCSARPVASKDGARIGVTFALEYCVGTERGFEAQLKPADAGEEAGDLHAPPLPADARAER